MLVRFSLEDSIAYLHSLERFGVRPGLERMRALCNLLGNPQENLRFIHVAGTNGKGSTCMMLEGILRRAGYKTGLFISPFVYDFRERIQVNGNPVDGGLFADAIARVRAVLKTAPSLEITEFEALTAAAFLVYTHAKCSIVVLETGLGGRLDSTNVIAPPILAILTAISYDHTAILGDTIEAITREKCGIIKGGTAVIYPEQFLGAQGVIEEHAEKLGCKIHRPDLTKVHEINADRSGTTVEYDNITVTIPLLGEHMVKNTAVVLESVKVLRRLGFIISDRAIIEGIRGTKLPARMEYREVEGLPTLIDGGHNEGCALALAQVLKRHFGGLEIYSLCGMMADKDARAYLAALAPYITHMTTVTLPPPRGEKAENLAKTALSLGIDCDVSDDPAGAYAALKTRLRKQEDRLILVCGSFLLPGQLRI